MARAFDRASLVAAFDRISEAERGHGAVLEIAVHGGGSALMLTGRRRIDALPGTVADHLSKPFRLPREAP